MSTNYTSLSAIVSAVDGGTPLVDTDRWIHGGKEWAIGGEHPRYFRVAVGSSSGGGTSVALTEPQVVMIQALTDKVDQNTAVVESNAQKIINSEQSTEILRTRLTTVEETLDDPEFMLYPQWTATNTSHTVSVLVNSIRVSVELKDNGNPAVNPVPPLTSTDAQFQAAFDNWALADQTSGKSHIPEIMHLAHTGSIWNVLNGKNYQLFDAAATFAQKAASPIGNPVYREHTQ